MAPPSCWGGFHGGSVQAELPRCREPLPTQPHCHLGVPADVHQEPRWVRQAFDQKRHPKADLASDESTRLAEPILSDSWKLVQSQLPEGTTAATTSSTNHLFKCYGKLCVRTILFLTKEEKFAPEQQKYEALGQILDRFTEDVSNVSKPSQAAEPSTIQDAVSAQAWEATLLQNTHIKVCEQCPWLHVQEAVLLF